jgi:hypothetical protein
MKDTAAAALLYVSRVTAAKRFLPAYRLLADTVEKLKNEMTAKFRGTHVEADLAQRGAL